MCHVRQSNPNFLLAFHSHGYVSLAFRPVDERLANVSVVFCTNIIIFGFFHSQKKFRFKLIGFSGRGLFLLFKLIIATVTQMKAT